MKRYIGIAVVLLGGGMIGGALAQESPSGWLIALGFITLIAGGGLFGSTFASLKKTASSLDTPADKTQPYNKWVYGAFVLLALYHLIWGDFGSAAGTLGIALVFDPFDQTQPWGERPLWQKAWLMIHLSLALGLLGITLYDANVGSDLQSGWQDGLNGA